MDGFIPHGHCFYWIPELLWTLVISDAVIVVSYYAIPLIIFYLIHNRLKRADRELIIIFAMFGLFIIACGTTHLISIVTIWHPDYWLSALAKSITAGISLITVIMLIPILKKADKYVLERETTNIVLQAKNVELKHDLDEFELQKRELTALNKMSDYLQACNTTDEISSALISAIKQIWPDASGAFYLLNKEQGKYDKLDEWGIKKNVSDISSNECWAHRLSKPFPDFASSGTVNCNVEGCSQSEAQSCFPIMSGGESFALLHISGVNFSNNLHYQDMAKIVCERLGLAIYNLQLKDYLEFKSTRDVLTGLCNRQYMEQALKTEIQRASRDDKLLTVAFIDIDHFKKTNDFYGHGAGDYLLKKFSQSILSSLRAGDVACRYGGDEFLVIFPDTNTHEVELVLERISRTIKRGIDDESKSLDMTFSSGVAQFPIHGSNYKELLKQADLALYEAKDNGRNRIEIAKN
tara:strand:- start:344 stop:1738 length:1395 start_codon:yes stop_codon:yes gene_type:complete